MDYTRQIAAQSARWYNDGLKKARIRDLSGAAASLKESLKYNKRNADARNLLGLVYYGRGEVAEAIVQWIISKDFKQKNNIADEYIRRIQESSGELETVNQAVKKYNQCLLYCEQNAEDLAIIQLRKIVASHPSFLKAYQLLAFLYLHTEQYEKARQVLREAKKLDTTNDVTARYIHALNEAKGVKGIGIRRQKEQFVEYRSGNETIIQPEGVSFTGSSERTTLLNILAGILLGAAAVWFLIMPAIDRSDSERMNAQMIAYSDRIHTLEAQNSALTRTLDEYRAAESDAAAAMHNAAATADSYENLLYAEAMDASGEYSEEVIADALLSVVKGALGSGGQELFDSLTAENYPAACRIRYESGVASLNVANYPAAIDQLSKTVMMDESYEEGGALLSLGAAYMNSGDNASAENYFRRVIELFADTETASEAQGYLNSMTQSDAGSQNNTGADNGGQ